MRISQRSGGAAGVGFEGPGPKEGRRDKTYESMGNLEGLGSIGWDVMRWDGIEEKESGWWFCLCEWWLMGWDGMGLGWIGLGRRRRRRRRWLVLRLCLSPSLSLCGFVLGILEKGVNNGMDVGADGVGHFWCFDSM
ncbi:hypothetical protein ACFX15_002592 [Malus domestica]